MGRRIFAIVFIYVCTAAAWIILAGTVFVRTESQDVRMRDAVRELWGSPQTQVQPSVMSRPGRGGEEGTVVALDSSDVKVDLKLEYRRKGLLWYSTYRVHFDGIYQISNSTEQTQEREVRFAFPSERAMYDNFHFKIGGQEVEETSMQSGSIAKVIRLEPGRTEEIAVSYDSQGLDEWRYDFGSSVRRVRNFSLALTTDFDRIDFPAQSISPTAKEQTAGGWKLTWEYTNLMTGVQIGMILPKKLNPGPWVGQVTAAAPVSLFLYFFLLFVITTVRKVRLHPMNYFFIGTAFFSFHLLLAYLVDHVSIHAAFWICSAVSVFLVISYMRLVAGVRFALMEAALSQIVYLVLFSYTFFFKGYTGLAITVLCICTLFIVMQFTGRVDWDKVFAKDSPPVLPLK